jgi:hypothetical protein
MPGSAADGDPRPRRPGKEQAMILIGLIIVAVIILLTVRRIRRKP